MVLNKPKMTDRHRPHRRACKFHAPAAMHRYAKLKQIRVVLVKPKITVNREPLFIFF